MDFQTARELALAMPGTLEKEHFGKPSYSVKKKIYLTLWLDEGRAVLKLTPLQQAELSEDHPEAFAPVPNKFGAHGWTNVRLDRTTEHLFHRVMDLAWRNVAPKWLLPTRKRPDEAKQEGY